MLSPQLLEVLREWWRQCRSQGWLFPGRDPFLPISTRQLNRACHMGARATPDRSLDLRRRGGCAPTGDTRRSIRTAAAGKCFLDMLGVLAEFEMNLRRERQLDCRG
jgi:integrase